METVLDSIKRIFEATAQIFTVADESLDNLIPTFDQARIASFDQARIVSFGIIRIN